MTGTADFFVVRRSSTALSNKVIHNPNLSFPALGLLMASLALPPNAPAGYRAFLGRGLGEKAVRKSLRELEEMNHRFRFRIRREGQLRELTIVSDTPITKDEARAEIVALMAADAVKKAQIGDCVSHPEPKLSTEAPAPEPVDNDRAADGAARCDQQEYKAESLTVPRSSAARSRTAHTSNEVSNDSSLRSESHTNQPEAKARGAAPTPVGVDGEVPPPRDAPPDGVERPDWDLLDECLPAPMRRGLSQTAGVRITNALLQAQGAGWRSGQIYRALNDNPLPEAMRNRTGLVIHRIQQIAQTPGPAARRRTDHWPDTRAANPVPMPENVRVLFQKTTTASPQVAPRKEAQ